MTDITGPILDTLPHLRAELLELERLEHPPLHDRLGRRWEWTTGDLYTHCGITVNAEIVPTLERHLSDGARGNVNYRDSCDLCWGPRGNPFAEEDTPNDVP